MQAIILAAGKGTRMGSLTETLPKPMLPINGKTLLEHKFDQLPAVIDEIIIVIGYLGDVIKERYGNEYNSTKITYMEQTELNGTGGALLLLQPILNERFMILMGDDIYAREDMENCIATEGWSLLLEDMEHMAAGGKMIVNDKGEVVGIEEGNHRGTPGLFNTNLAVLDRRIFDFPPVPKNEGSAEFGLPHHMVQASLAGNIPIHAVMTTFWIQITAPEDLERASTLMGS
ncbi:nucleotidyltransferase family protein [Patescibacteria group bacterium]|nr:nucleotidyltransferase family protein [Patescibacteria group bacterium]MBU1755351.1 nucleotidyltransferase family protein [Patescibacteria group bacterium]